MTTPDLRLLTEGLADGELSTRIMGIHNASDYLDQLANKIDPNREPYYTLATLDTSTKKRILYEIRDQCQRKVPPYKSCHFKVAKYQEPACGKRYELRKDKRIPFCVTIPTDLERQFLEDQYIRVRTSVPKLDPTFNPATIPDYDSTKVLFSYCAKPGIRLFPEYSLTIENHDVEKIEWDEVLHLDKELMPENMLVLWNELIGHDLGQEIEVTLPDSNATLIHKVKLGNQTKTNNPEPLLLNVPLLFDHNDEELNTSLLKKQAVQLTGLFEKSDLIVRADYVDSVNPPIRLPVAPLVIEEISILSNYTKSSDNMTALKTNLAMSKLITMMEIDRYKVQDLDKPLLVKGHGVLEALGVIIIPKHYEDDFYLWDRYEQVKEKCVHFPIMVNDEEGDPFRVAVAGVPALLSDSPIEKIGLSWNDIEIKELLPAEIYRVHQKYRMAKQAPSYHVRDVNGLHMFLFNDLMYTRQFSGVFNLSSIRQPEIEFKFKKELVDALNNILLCEEYVFKVFRFHVNTLTSYGRTMGVNYIQ